MILIYHFNINDIVIWKSFYNRVIGPYNNDKVMHVTKISAKRKYKGYSGKDESR